DHLLNSGLAAIDTVPFGGLLANPGADPNSLRPYPSYNGINLLDHTLYSNYHSWQNLLSRQTGKFSFTAAYTLSKALGIRGGARGRSGFGVARRGRRLSRRTWAT